MITGVDVSRWQPTWSPQPEDEFVFIKATEGRTVLNPVRQGQADAARAAGLVVGWYHFLWPENPQAQAAYFVEHALIEPGDLLVCDWEQVGANREIASEADKDAFIGETQRLAPRHRVGLYTYTSLWNTSAKQAGDFLWIAHYRVATPNVSEPWMFWQWTDEPIDQNYAQFDSRESLRAWAEALEDDLPLSDDDLTKIRTVVQEELEAALETALPLIWDSPEVDTIKDGAEVIRPRTALARLLALARGR